VPKSELRKRLREQLNAISRDVMQQRSRTVCRLLCEQEEYDQAEVLMVFLSTPYEVDTQHLVQQAWGDLKRVLAPRVTWDQRRMLAIEIQSLASGVEVDQMGIRQPVEGLPVPIADIDLVVLPGLGFDEQGNRLGRGRGFYDRFLSRPDFRGTACAVAFEEQVIRSIPVGPLDMQVDMLVTDVQVRRYTR
jgi:5-formyltetrahydrofolate cyclo-ligase